MKARAGVRSLTFVVSMVALLLATEARAGSTSLAMTGDPGDYITGGRTYYYTGTDGPFTATRNYHNGVSLSFHTPTYSHWWYLDFSAPAQQFLTVGLYAGALRFPFEGTQAGLSVSGDGRGCNTLTGSFEVKEVVYGSGNVVLSFRATFEQHCEGFVPAARGEIRYNATVPVEITAPTTLSSYEQQGVSFPVTATDTLGRHVSLSATGLPAGASFVDDGNNTGAFAWTPSVGQAGTYIVSFRGDNGAGDVETVLTTITVVARPPANDDISAAIVIEDIPFTLSQTTTLATAGYDDPFCAGASHTVWYSFTPTVDTRVEINTFGSDYDTTLSVYTGVRGALAQVACNDNSGRSSQSMVRFNAAAGETYWIMAGAYYGSSGGHLVLNAVQAPPPLSIGLTIAGFGDVDPTTGEAHPIGSITCSRPVLVTISGQLKQDHAGTALTGRFALVASCDETTDWIAAVVVPPTLFEGRAAGLFVAGRADVTASAYAADQDAGETAWSNAATTIVLRGGR